MEKRGFPCKTVEFVGCTIKDFAEREIGKLTQIHVRFPTPRDIGVMKVHFPYISCVTLGDFSTVFARKGSLFFFPNFAKKLYPNLRDRHQAFHAEVPKAF